MCVCVWVGRSSFTRSLFLRKTKKTREKMKAMFVLCFSGLDHVLKSNLMPEGEKLKIT